MVKVLDCDFSFLAQGDSNFVEGSVLSTVWEISVATHRIRRTFLILVIEKNLFIKINVGL
jgi:hypothetical protein